MIHPKVSAIIPAYNEEKNILRVLKVVTQSPLIDEVIVVNDGSTDNTTQVAQNFNQDIRLINLEKNRGKADALWQGAKKAQGEILFFCDADLIGFKEKHLKQLILPVQKGETAMVVGSQEEMTVWPIFNRRGRKIKKEPSDLIKIIGGEKVLWKKDFLKIKNIKGSDYGIEQNIVNYFVKKKKFFRFIVLQGVGHVWKVKKWGLIKGLKKELAAFVIIGFKHLQYKLLKRKTPG